jgi:hypothetical protein
MTITFMHVFVTLVLEPHGYGEKGFMICIPIIR